MTDWHDLPRVAIIVGRLKSCLGLKRAKQGFRRPDAYRRVELFSLMQTIRARGLSAMFRRLGVRGEAVDGCPKLWAVVGVGQVAEFVDADVVCDVIRCADEPPVEADAGGVAANAPEGLALERAVAAGMRAVVRAWCSRRGSRYSRARSCRKAAQVGQLGGGFFVGQQDFQTA